MSRDQAAALKEYQRKRNFHGASRTTEPRAGGSRSRKPIFVVQLHHASHRHYDFRLEHAGTLKSWAIPKGPSLDPKVKRLAVQVEDHPISYASFEGDIPQGHYGAGQVQRFDHGTWSSTQDIDEQLRKGHLHFTLQGSLLKGKWNLVRTHRQGRQPQWLLMKVADTEAAESSADDLLAPAIDTRRSDRADPKTDFSPELCVSAESPPEGEQWLHEVKWDGYRLLTGISGGKVRLWSRNAIEWTEKIPQVVTALRKLKLKSAQLDGELVVLEDERSSFNALKLRLAGENDLPLSYMLFDLVHLNGRSLSQLPLLERKQRLKQLLEKQSQTELRYSEHVIGNGTSLFRQALDHGLEGIVSKRSDSPYSGGRNGAWIKTKDRLSDEFVIIGYTAPKGSRSSLGALLLATAEQGGLRYAGRCGSGFDDRILPKLKKSLDRSSIDAPVADVSSLEPRVRSTVQWVRPQQVVEVYYSGFGTRGLLRHPVFKTLRQDKTAADVLGPATTTTPASKSARRTRREPETAVEQAVTITHPQRIMFPDTGITKADIADYYRQVMPRFLPGIINRPLSVIRAPEGIDGEIFFQKHVGKGWGAQILGVTLDQKAGSAKYLYVADAAGVLQLVQMNVIEFHPWGATVTDPDHADSIVFDLDPDAGVPWKRTVKAAQTLRDLLDSVGLQTFVRTTGGKGLHVVLPLSAVAPWSQAKDFSHSVASVITQAEPAAFTDKAAKSKRKDRIFIDWLRNGRGATSVASYSLRARPGAGVAMPLTWSELSRIKSADAFDLAKTLKRLRHQSLDPWRGFTDVEQSLDGLHQRLQKI